MLKTQAWAAPALVPRWVRLLALMDLFSVYLLPFPQLPWGHPEIKQRLRETGTDLGKREQISNVFFPNQELWFCSLNFIYD